MIYAQCMAYAPLVSLIGTRLYPFGEAPQPPTVPYVVWQVVGGGPLNYINGRPDTDQLSLQVDIYASTAQSADAVFAAMRDAIEGAAHITAYGIEGRDPGTKRYRKGFAVDWFVPA